MQIQISWLLKKLTDLDLHCLQRQGISGSAGQGLINKIQAVIHVYSRHSTFPKYCLFAFPYTVSSDKGSFLKGKKASKLIFFPFPVDLFQKGGKINVYRVTSLKLHHFPIP